MSRMHRVETASSPAIRPYVAAIPISATEIPPAAGPTIPPACETLLVHDTPFVAWSSGITWASNEVSAGRSNPLATPVAKTTMRIAASEIPPGLADRTARIAEQAMTPTLVMRTIERRSRRSATCPPNRTSDRAGIASTSPSQPRASGSWVMSYVWNATTVTSALIARAYVRRAPSSARNSGSASGDGGPSGPVRLMPASVDDCAPRRPRPGQPGSGRARTNAAVRSRTSSRTGLRPWPRRG